MSKARHELELAEFFRRELERQRAARADASCADTNPECKCAYHFGIALLDKGLDSPKKSGEWVIPNQQRN